MKNVAVIISGCGYLDGAEIFETVFTLLELDKHNVNVKIFAPNKNQHQMGLKSLKQFLHYWNLISIM
ncbi:hypothetical protein [Candidatus Tisiphia endosymbiont of Metellina segmentata]|uniref:hypothetical protein n=1 Tax=Candidatus Tisiphia endosymbiont of Metellina segmentata TaxID=3066274 RepID=UPI00313BCDF2